MYASFPVYDQYCGATVLVNGQPVGRDPLQGENGTVFLGQVTEGQRLTVELCSAGEQLALAGWRFAVEVPAALQAACAELAQGGISLQSWGSGYLKGSLTAGPGASALFTSIPYEKGWSVWVDGQPVQPYAALGSLLAAPLTPGAHTVELRFVPRGSGGPCAQLWQRRGDRRLVLADGSAEKSALPAPDPAVSQRCAPAFLARDPWAPFVTSAKSAKFICIFLTKEYRCLTIRNVLVWV